MTLVLWFALGVALQLAILIRGDWNWGKLATCAGISLFCCLPPWGHDANYDLPFHVLFTLGVFAFLFSWLFQKDVLPVVSERVLLSYTLMFWFAFFTLFYDGSENRRTVAVLGAIPTALTLVVSIARPLLGAAVKVILYTWFLCIIVFVGLLEFPVNHLGIFLDPSNSPWLRPIDCITSGMAFLYLVVNVSYLYELVPIPNRSQSFASRIAEWHELTNLMTRRIDDDTPGYAQIALIIVGQGGLLFLIYRYQWVSTSLVIDVLLVLPSVLVLGRNSVKESLRAMRTNRGMSPQETSER